MIACESPFVVKLLCAFQTRQRLYLVMPLYPGGDLSFRIRKMGPFPIEHVRFYMAELVCALHSMHMNYVCHRDIKPDNVLVDKDGHIAITDLGLAVICDPDVSIAIAPK